MVGQPDWEERCQLGVDESTPGEVREEPLRDPDARVRAAAAQHASPEQLRNLATDPRAEVRLAVGANERTPGRCAPGTHRGPFCQRSMVGGHGRSRAAKQGVLRRLGNDCDRLVASAAHAALDDMRAYRRMLDLPGESLARLAHRLIERRQRG